jgi:FkbM family methyltransferase
MKKIIKAVYDFIPFKKELFTALRVIWKPRERIFKHLHFVGVFTVPVTEEKKFKIKHYGYQIENEVFWSGLTSGWEKESIKLWMKLCETSEVIFDIGANTGIYSLMAKCIRPDASVYAFEPVARVFTKLKENIALNRYDIIPVKKAMSNTDGVAIIYDTSTEHTYSVTVNKNLNAKEIDVVETKIETITMDSFIREKNIKKIDLIKIDVETHEPEVIEGFSEYISRFQPSILIEILNNDIGEKISKMIQHLDYLYFNIDERGGIRQVSKITKSDYYNYLLCDAQIASKIGLIHKGSISKKSMA